MAEAMMGQLGGAEVEVVSAGSHPKAMHADAVRVMRDRGLDLSGCRSKHLSEFVEQRFDYVISLCDRVREVCPDFPGSPAVAHWGIPDPGVHADGKVRHAAFVRTANELTTRIEFLLSAIVETSVSSERS
jgi:protein-tyrosine-phosphatase